MSGNGLSRPPVTERAAGDEAVTLALPVSAGNTCFCCLASHGVRCRVCGRQEDHKVVEKFIMKKFVSFTDIC